ncbi:hypothetical protein D3C85_1773420 [compost metagenome]
MVTAVSAAGSLPSDQATPPCPTTCMTPMPIQALQPAQVSGIRSSPRTSDTPSSSGRPNPVDHSMIRIAPAEARAAFTARK